MRMHSLSVILCRYRLSRLATSNISCSLAPGKKQPDFLIREHSRIHKKGSRLSWVIYRIPARRATLQLAGNPVGKSMGSSIPYTWQESLAVEHQQDRPMIFPVVLGRPTNYLTRLSS